MPGMLTMPGIITRTDVTAREPRPFQDHHVNPGMVKGRLMEALARRAASVVSWRR
jgi:hypothetical protein